MADVGCWLLMVDSGWFVFGVSVGCGLAISLPLFWFLFLWLFVVVVVDVVIVCRCSFVGWCCRMFVVDVGVYWLIGWFVCLCVAFV